MSSKVKYLCLGLIIFIAFALRFWQLGINPPSLTWDEVAWGYNAYSLGIDGKDEFGRFLPVDYLESFGDFKPPVYAYLDILPIKVFGLNEFAVRFPSAFFGTITVILSYYLITYCFYKSKNKEIYGLLTALFLAISPWHIMLSRAAFEANIANFLIVLAMTFFLIALKKSPWFLTASVLSFLLSAYTFNTARIVSPLMLFSLLIIFHSFLRKNIKISCITFFIAGVCALPLFFFLLTPQAKLRYQEVNIFTDPSIVNRSNQQVKNNNDAWWAKIIDNRRFGYSAEYVLHYLDNVAPSFLFVRGDGNSKFSTQDVGQMYLWEFPFFIAGILFLFKKREGYWWIIPGWLLISIIPAATARETPHALRIESALPTFQFLSAYGLFWVISSLKYQYKEIKIKYILAILVIITGSFMFLYFVYNYFVHYANEFSGDWQYGYKQAVEYAKNHPEYKRVIMTGALGRPYIYALFYEKYDPKKFRKNAKVEREVLGFVHVNSFGRYTFSEDFKNSNISGKTLLINSKENMPTGATKLKEIRLLNGDPILVLYSK